MASAPVVSGKRSGRQGHLAAVFGALISVTILVSSCGNDDDSESITSDAPTVDTAQCDSYVGIWEADEEAGSEDEVGGIYRAQLNLPRAGEATWSESDFIETWRSWSCVGDEIIGFSDSNVRWVDGEQVTRNPNPCPDLTTSEARAAVPEDDTIVSTNDWVRCRGGRLEEGAAIATIGSDGTLERNGFTLIP